MRKILLVILLAGGAGTSPLAISGYWSGEELYDYCTSKDPEFNAWCHTYIAAVADTHETLSIQTRGDLVCKPDAVTPSELTKKFMAYARVHPEQLKTTASDSVGRALATYYPCE